jgi:hypothetical protein
MERAPGSIGRAGVLLLRQANISYLSELIPPSCILQELRGVNSQTPYGLQLTSQQT